MSYITVCGATRLDGNTCYSTSPSVPWPSHPGFFYCESCHTVFQHSIVTVDARAATVDESFTNDTSEASTE